MKPKRNNKPLTTAIGLFFGLVLFVGCTCNKDELIANTWVLEQYGPGNALVNVSFPQQDSLAAKKEIMLKFDTASRFSGSDGCNHIFGSYTLDKRCRLSVGKIGTTLMMCRPAIMKQAGVINNILRNVKTYKIKGAYLVLSNDNKEILKYRKK